MYNVTINSPEDGIRIETFDTREQADAYAEAVFDSMDTSEARETAVHVDKVETGLPVFEGLMRELFR